MLENIIRLLLQARKGYPITLYAYLMLSDNFRRLEKDMRSYLLDRNGYPKNFTG